MTPERVLECLAGPPQAAPHLGTGAD
jgi:hypothetical protein